MARSDVVRYIKRRNRHIPSVDDHIDLAHAFYNEGIGPAHEGIREAQFEEVFDISLEYSIETSRNHLLRINLLERDMPSGPDSIVVADWHDPSIILGKVTETARKGIEALIAELPDEAGDTAPAVADGGIATLRDVLAVEFGCATTDLEEVLRSDDPVPTLNLAVDAIEDDGRYSVGPDYGRIELKNTACRYRLSTFAWDLYEQDEGGLSAFS